FWTHTRLIQLFLNALQHSVAINSGFRNSGITVGKKGKIIMAVRSTHCLEVPLSHKGQVLVQEEYIDYVVQVANRKIEENRKRIERLVELHASSTTDNLEWLRFEDCLYKWK
ncbi:TYW3 protein, partial [Polyodon spathula]|nr:TYW3 protein [Polyodon spathula]